MSSLDYYRNPSEFIEQLNQALTHKIGLEIKETAPLNTDLSITFSVGDLLPVKNRNDGRKWHELEIHYEVISTGNNAELQTLDLSTRIEREFDNGLFYSNKTDQPQIISNERLYADPEGVLITRLITVRFMIALGSLEQGDHQIIDYGVKTDEFPPR